MKSNPAQSARSPMIRVMIAIITAGSAIVANAQA